MRIFRTRSFQRFARNEGIDVESLCKAVQGAERGLVDADLGGGVIKQRVPRPGEGKSGGFRTVILYRANELSFFVYGFPKSERRNITDDELKGFRKLAQEMLAYDEEQLNTAVERGVLGEVVCDEQNI